MRCLARSLIVMVKTKCLHRPHKRGNQFIHRDLIGHKVTGKGQDPVGKAVDRRLTWMVFRVERMIGFRGGIKIRF